MTARTLFAVFTLCFCTSLWTMGGLKAQTWEIGVNAGVMNYIGDLAPSTAINEFNPSAALFLRKNYSGYFSLNMAACYGSISGDDANFKQNQTRNLNFKSLIAELNATIEFNFTKYKIGQLARKFTPYTFIGLGITYYNPQGQLNGKWHDLRPLNTEGQGIGGSGNSYFLVTPVIPLGGGFKWSPGHKWSTNIHLGFRYAFTDYLDDVSTNYFDNDLLRSKKGDIAADLADKRTGGLGFEGKQRGDEYRNDWYFFLGISVSYSLSDDSCFEFNRR